MSLALCPWQTGSIQSPNGHVLDFIRHNMESKRACTNPAPPANGHVLDFILPQKDSIEIGGGKFEIWLKIPCKKKPKSVYNIIGEFWGRLGQYPATLATSLGQIGISGQKVGKQAVFSHSEPEKTTPHPVEMWCRCISGTTTRLLPGEY